MQVPRIPVMHGILPIDRTNISGEVVAGLTLAALAIPEVMGYPRLGDDDMIALVGPDGVPDSVDDPVGAYRRLTTGVN